MTIDRVLRLLVPQEVRALLERIDLLDDTFDSSYRPIRRLVTEGQFSTFERTLLRRALARLNRRVTLKDAMHIVIYGDVEQASHGLYAGGILTTTGAIGAGTFSTTKPNENRVVVKRKPASMESGT